MRLAADGNSDYASGMVDGPYKPSILVVDDEASVRAVLRAGLEAEGYIVSEAASFPAIERRLAESAPVDLVTLDLGLGGEDGLRLAREIRRRKNVPIVMITARVGPEDRVRGLEQGADDYIVKPFLIREVVLRLASVLRRYELEARAGSAPIADERYACGTGSIDAAKREARRSDGSLLPLTDAEFDLLLLMLRRPHRVLSRDEIMALLKRQTWSPMDRTIDGHIARLRKKIEPDAAVPSLIKSVRGVGYVFTGDVRRL